MRFMKNNSTRWTLLVHFFALQTFGCPCFYTESGITNQVTPIQNTIVHASYLIKSSLLLIAYTIPQFSEKYNDQAQERILYIGSVFESIAEKWNLWIIRYDQQYQLNLKDLYQIHQSLQQILSVIHSTNTCQDADACEDALMHIQITLESIRDTMDQPLHYYTMFTFSSIVQNFQKTTDLFDFLDEL